jgi:hypothetical protein
MILGKKMIFEQKLGKKKEGEINSMCVEPRLKSWVTFDPMFVHVIQLLHCWLFTRFPICLVGFIKIWLDHLHICIHVKHGIVLLLVHNKMCSSSPNTFTLPTKNIQFGQ